MLHAYSAQLWLMLTPALLIKHHVRSLNIAYVFFLKLCPNYVYNLLDFILTGSLCMRPCMKCIQPMPKGRLPLTFALSARTKRSLFLTPVTPAWADFQSSLRPWGQSDCNSWVSLRHFTVNLTGGQPRVSNLECTGVSKWYEIACICHQTQGQHIQWTINSLWWLCLDLELTPRQIYDVIWNPRMETGLNVPLAYVSVYCTSVWLIFFIRWHTLVRYAIVWQDL
jgi:hypothetical protein